jgi:hypothetical protein
MLSDGRSFLLAGLLLALRVPGYHGCERQRDRHASKPPLSTIEKR